MVTVMYPPPRSSSSGMRSIRRELQRRKSKPLAATRSVAKKPSASPPPPPSRHGCSDAVPDPCPSPPRREVPSSTTSHSRGSTVTDALPQPQPRAPSRRCTPATPPPPPRLFGWVRVPSFSRRPRPSDAWDGCSCPDEDGDAQDGAGSRALAQSHDRVVVVHPWSHGGCEVVYDANWPRGDPRSAVYVARHQIRVINNPSPTPTTTPPPSLPAPTAAVAATTKKETMPRPTTAGKSLRLIRSLFPEIELPACA